MRLGTSVAILSGAALALYGIPARAQGLLYGQQHAKHYTNSLAPYVVSPQQIVDRMLEIADLKPGETVYDLGSGDGRILITAVQRFHAKAVGIEISDALVESTTERIQRLGLQNDARVVHADFLTVDLGPADVVTMYLATRRVARLCRSRLEAEAGGQGSEGSARPHHLPLRNASHAEEVGGVLSCILSACPPPRPAMTSPESDSMQPTL
jgi:SAM-dependent methyltransferase